MANRFVDSPVVEHADCFCAMSQEAYARFNGLVAGTLIYDPDRVSLDRDGARRHLAIRASAIAEGDLGNSLLANVVFLGAATRVLEERLDPENVLAALAERITRFQEQNQRAFEAGWNRAR